MINLKFVRHSTTDLNGKGYVATQKDYPLNADGVNKCIQSRFNDGLFDAVYSSPFKRTIETAELIYPYIQPIITPLIAQRDLGIMNEHFKREYDLEYLKQVRDYLVNPSNAESLDDIIKRLNVFFDIVRDNNNDNSNILVVTHNGIMRIIKKEFLNGESYDESNYLSGFSMKLTKNNGI